MTGSQFISLSSLVLEKGYICVFRHKYFLLWLFSAELQGPIHIKINESNVLVSQRKPK